MTVFLANSMRKRLLNHLRNTNSPISIILDGTTDYSSQHFIIVYFSAIENNRNQHYFYDLLSVGLEEDSETLKKILFKKFEDDNILDLIQNNLVGYTSDGAHTMIKLKDLIKDELKKDLYFCACYAHKLELSKSIES